MSSVRVFSIKPEVIAEAVRRYAAGLVERDPTVVAVVWFGSWVTGRPTPGSDVDLCILLKESTLARRDRIPLFLPGAFPAGIDLFIYTFEELAELARSSPGWYRTICSGRVVAGAMPEAPSTLA